jgi:hypothetical protein
MAGKSGGGKSSSKKGTGKKESPLVWDGPQEGVTMRFPPGYKKPVKK